MNPLSLMAVVGAATWIVSEGVERAAGGLTPASLALTAVAFAGLALGAWGLGGRAPVRPSWRGASAVTSAGFALMAALSVQMLATGATTHEEGLLFFAAVGTFSVGLLWLGIQTTLTARHPRALGASFTAVALVSLAANAAEIGALASAANVGLAALFVAMAWPGVAVSRERARAG